MFKVKTTLFKGGFSYVEIYNKKFTVILCYFVKKISDKTRWVMEVLYKYKIIKTVWKSW